MSAPIEPVCYSRCQCGRITAYGPDYRPIGSALRRDKNKLFPGIDLRSLPRLPREFTATCPGCDAAGDNPARPFPSAPTTREPFAYDCTANAYRDAHTRVTYENPVVAVDRISMKCEFRGTRELVDIITAPFPPDPCTHLPRHAILDAETLIDAGASPETATAVLNLAVTGHAGIINAVEHALRPSVENPADALAAIAAEAKRVADGQEEQEEKTC